MVGGWQVSFGRGSGCGVADGGWLVKGGRGMEERWLVRSGKEVADIAAVVAAVIAAAPYVLSQITPSMARLPLYRGDLVTLLGAVAALLPCLVRRPHHLLQAEGQQQDLHSPVFGIHRRAQLLMAVAALKAAPIQLLADRRKVGRVRLGQAKLG